MNDTAPPVRPEFAENSDQSRLRGLLWANRTIVSELELTTVLRRIVEAACVLVHAPYGALGVISPSGGLEQFIHVGIDAATVARIGALPEGKGLLGALVNERAPIRLARMADDARSSGFPPGHPPMSSFLGVPIRVRGEIYGNLYLTGHDDDLMTAADEELVIALAASAGVAIENARLFEQAGRRQDWLQASMEITRQLLSDEGEEPLRVIARRLEEIADADAVNVVLPTRNGSRLMVEVATGAGAQDITAATYPIGGTVSQQVLRAGRAVLIADVATAGEGTVHLSEVADIGPVMALPLSGTERTRGVLIAARLRGRRAFSTGDLDLATTYANHAALALELADSRSRSSRLALLEDRERIARDLHDHVIQRLFGAGLTIESVASSVDSEASAARLAQVVGDLDETIRQIRTSIFQLRGPLAPATRTVRAEVMALVDEIAPHLGYQPLVRFEGTDDTVVSDAVVRDLLAVVREGLMNVARHANASWARIDVRIDDSQPQRQLSLELTDDGVGIGDSRRRSGLANLAERAEHHGGNLAIVSPATVMTERGTKLAWTIPLH